MRLYISVLGSAGHIRLTPANQLGGDGDGVENTVSHSSIRDSNPHLLETGRTAIPT